MNPQNNSGSNYGSADAWSKIISGVGQGAGSAMQGNAANANSRQEARESRRRTLANLLNGALRRNKDLFKAGRDESNEMNDFQSQALQQISRGFVDALNGSTRY